MKLDSRSMRYLTAEDWRVLTAVETGSRNHEVVPTPLISQISSLRGGSSVHKCISSLAKVNLIAKVRNVKYDGYRLTYGGLDYLALHTHQKQKSIYSVGNQIGVGKESDIIVVANPAGIQLVLKIHRLGRISFRTVKNNRDYLRHRSSASWMYMSRLAALKEFTFMKALRENGFPVPEPVAQNRHTVVMELIDAFPLRQIASVPNPASLYAELIDMILRLARVGLIHGDFNEFNILIKEEEEVLRSDSSSTKLGKQPEGSSQETKIRLIPIMIDFPQMISIDHPNAEMYFDRDVNCVKGYFERRFHFVSDEPGPFFGDARKQLGKVVGGGGVGGGGGLKRLDVEVEASGFSRKMAKELGTYMKEVGVDGDSRADDGDGGGEFEGDSEDEDDHDDDEEGDEENVEGDEENRSGNEDGEADNVDLKRESLDGKKDREQGLRLNALRLSDTPLEAKNG